MNRISQRLYVALALMTAAATLSDSASSTRGDQSSGLAADAISRLAAGLIADAIPREYARTKDWGKTREITTGIRSSGNFFDFDIHKKKTTVKDGIWKSYRVTLVDPDKNLDIKIDNLRSEADGKIGLTLFVTARLHGWARTKIYESGVHIISLEAEGDTKVSLWLDTEIAVSPAPSKSLIPGITVHPHVTKTRLKLEDFRLTRISDVKGPPVEELSSGLRHLVEDEFTGPKLTDKINHAIDRRPERLTFTPEMLWGKAVAKQAPRP